MASVTAITPVTKAQADQTSGWKLLAVTARATALTSPVASRMTPSRAIHRSAPSANTLSPEATALDDILTLGR